VPLGFSSAGLTKSHSTSALNSETPWLVRRTRATAGSATHPKALLGCERRSIAWSEQKSHSDDDCDAKRLREPCQGHGTPFHVVKSATLFLHVCDACSGL